MEAGKELFRQFGVQEVLQDLHHFLLVIPKEAVQRTKNRAQSSMAVRGIGQDKGSHGAQEGYFPVYSGDFQGGVEELLLPRSESLDL